MRTAALSVVPQQLPHVLSEWMMVVWGKSQPGPCIWAMEPPAKPPRAEMVLQLPLVSSPGNPAKAGQLTWCRRVMAVRWEWVGKATGQPGSSDCVIARFPWPEYSSWLPHTSFRALLKHGLPRRLSLTDRVKVPQPSPHYLPSLQGYFSPKYVLPKILYVSLIYFIYHLFLRSKNYVYLIHRDIPVARMASDIP